MSEQPQALPPLSALDERTQAFPVLTAAQIERARQFGKVRPVKAGDVLFEPGDTHVPLFVMLSGKMEIVQPDGDREQPVAAHVAGEFTGELAMISGRGCLVRGRVTEPGEFIEISPEGFRSLVAKDAELSEVLMRAFILRRLLLIAHGRGGVVLMGSRHSAGTLGMREFLGRNGHPYIYVDLDTDAQAQELLDRFNVSTKDVPILICGGSYVMRNPTVQQVAQCLGLNPAVDEKQIRDVVVVGAGPAGLAAAVYAASEGLDVLVLETSAPGGQAGSSSKIENYLGFPTGISGLELATRALSQAQKFGAEMLVAESAVRLDCARTPYQLELDDGKKLHARAIVIATGAQYNKPNIPNLMRFEGIGIYYGATFIESQLCGQEEVIVVGGGNSAGQAAVYLSQTARKVYMLVRSEKLADTMSRYLIQRIEENPGIELHMNTEIVAIEGETHVECVQWRNNQTGEVETKAIRHVFLMTGAAPNTAWLKGCLALDSKGFILTGRELDPETLREARWNSPRAPHLLETSLPGVFAVGDVRSGNVKRVASAVGEGSIAIHLVHRVLAGV